MSEQAGLMQGRGTSRRWLFAALLALWAVTAMAQAAEGVSVRRAVIEPREDGHYLSARIDYRLTPEVIEALDSGVTLSFQLRVQLEEPRRWWMDRELAALELRYSLRYHALSGRYVLVRLDTGESRSFATRGSALYVLGQVEGLRLLGPQALEPGERYTARLHAALDTAALPLPLRTLAVMSPAWRLGSEWYEWHFDG
ncbi:DUF4390 domain-containing protein [Alkalilimnicola sp. S0819]|uniref:DUF4390 domain-containing protein n=1 Tax=Alkalilimnicola sp. S0819 TaxID=2613922 RepID=UPI0012628FFF|nr:DUF4390 domain-containing protein [Alkalilimnicola sp. S0819]KAB7627245.1 DUF4390 domain-containing protein [Alkalilimnicola sp. S0819]MPQ15958.1 DUF4390 domain-containing protein [Alkalilimnicola sp. S0819]